MPNEMTAAEAAEIIEKLIPDIENDMTIYAYESEALRIAASYLRRIATGEYKRVVYCDDCAFLDRSPCPARDPETGKTRNCVGYCGAGAPMGGKDDGDD